MYPHRIHLRGPWDCEPLARTVLRADGGLEIVDQPLPPRSRVTMPCRWQDGGLRDFAGRVRFHRRFHWPGRLDSYERLWLVFEAADYYSAVWLNGEKLGKHEGAFDPFEFDVTSRIKLRNDLVVEVHLPALHPAAQDYQRLIRGVLPQRNGGLWGDVALEVRREAVLQDVRMWATTPLSPPSQGGDRGGTPVLHVAGQVHGQIERPLELYLLLDGSTIVYELLRPGSEAFEVAADVPGVERWKPNQSVPRLHDVRIELIDRATKLDSVARPFGFRHVTRAATDDGIIVEGVTHSLRSDVQVVDLLEPITMSGVFEPLNAKGAMVWLNLPLHGGYAPTESVRAEAVRQVRRIVGRLQHHPCIVGWTCHVNPQSHDQNLDEAIYQAVKQLDPTRPAKMRN